MLKGSITFAARLTGNPLRFPSIELRATQPVVDRIELESDGSEVRAVIYFASVGTIQEAEHAAVAWATTRLDRLAFQFRLPIAEARKTDSGFQSLEPRVLVAEAGECRIEGHAAVLGVGLGLASAESLKAVLEAESLPGERMFGIFRSALGSGSTVECYLHLYHILMMLRRDDPKLIDEFIVREQPLVPQSPCPRARSRGRRRHTSPPRETVYTRLRHEFAHGRGVPLDSTKQEMSEWVGKLSELTQRAIEVHG